MFLTTEQLKERVKELIYFPGWTLEIYEGNFEGIKLKIEADVFDYTKKMDFVMDPMKKKEVIHLHIVRPIDNLFENIKQFDLWLVRTLNRIAVHESMEALRTVSDGKPVIDPHVIGDRDLLNSEQGAEE